jgi:hypothetical protein
VTTFVYVGASFLVEIEARGCAGAFSLSTVSPVIGSAARLNLIVKSVINRAGPAIIATWCILALGRRLRCERSWPEWSGHFLCAGWVLLWLFDTVAGVVGWQV